MSDLSTFKSIRRENQRLELDRRSGLNRRIRVDTAMRELNTQRCWDDRRTEARRNNDNTAVAAWLSIFDTARAA